ncbi:MFS transporter [Legionella waltersii]|uniref:Transporter of the major facilitator superfamily (MFS) n=1 Tax=Legionella waltersii TaxID=66969 RepID=A0A0W1AMQ5_9GAMM|nr:MFS transporter [Legionella waltersii]KTD82574.1 transporter of the major facilitator superfamily (MFS) [Legionella waltersii]SNV02483.1 transporter of the major facilitator superfamily (MFS) [Legionella waltersii]
MENTLPQSQIREYLPLYAVILLGFLGYALTITLFIPMLMDSNFSLLPSDASTSVRVSLSGLLLAMYPLGQFFGSPIIGNLSDQYGRKRVLVLSLIACTFGFFGMALSIQFHVLNLLFLSSFLTGLFESNMAISQSVIADRTQDSALKTKLIGYGYSACSLGYIIGPLLAGNTLSYSTPFFIVALFVPLLAVWIYYSFGDDFVPNTKTKINFTKSIISIKSIFHNSSIRKIYFINFLIFFSVQGLYRVVPLYIEDTWDISLHTFSLLISFVSLMCFIANLLLLNKLATRFSTKVLLGGLLIVSSLSVLLIIVPDNFNWIWLTYGCAVIPTIMMLPTCTTWLSEHVSSQEQGQVLGNNQALLVLGESTSAALGGVVAAIMVPLPIVMTAVILLMTGFLVLRDKS